MLLPPENLGAPDELPPDDSTVGLWPALFAVQGPGERTARHQHHGLHLVLARQGALKVDLAVERSGAESWTSAAGVLTAPGRLHAIDARGVNTVLLFVDPESDASAALQLELDGDARLIDAVFRDALLVSLPAAPDGDALTSWMHVALAMLGVGSAGDERARVVHPAVRRVMRLLERAPLEPAPLLDDMAARVGLSASRFMHVFAESLGTTWRSYVRWLRFCRAAGALRSGASLTEVALAAGFHDASHMTRTFKEMYGLTPSRLQRVAAEEAT